MLVFKDPLKLLSDSGWSTYKLIKERQLPNGTIDRLRKGKAITTDTVEVICRLCDCQPNDFLRHVPDAKEDGQE